MGIISFPLKQRVNQSKELNKLMAAAVVSEAFRKLLLSEPEMALKQGYNGEQFHLTAEEQELILSIRASSLADFAQQLSLERTKETHLFHAVDLNGI